MSYEKWKHLKYIFSFQNSVFNGIFVIKLTYPATMFDKFFEFFFLVVKPNRNFWSWKLGLS